MKKAGSRLKVASAGCMIGCIITRLLTPGQDILSAKRLEIVDEQGRPKVVAHATGRGPQLTLHDSAQSTLELSIDDATGHARLSMRDANSNERFGLDVRPNGEASLRIGSDNERRLALVVDANNAARCEIFGANDSLLRMGDFEKGLAIHMRAPGGRYETIVSTWSAGAKLELREQGKSAVQLAVDAEGAGLAVSDASGKERIKILSLHDGQSGIALYDADGRLKVRYGAEEPSSNRKDGGK